MIVNIAAFCDEPIRTELIKAANIRAEALDIAYSIKGYKEAPLDTKNFIYDAINKALSAVENGRF